MDAFYTFKKIESKVPHSIIMTSGTLSPMDEFESGIGIEFPIKHQGTHVIDPQIQLRSFIVN